MHKANLSPATPTSCIDTCLCPVWSTSDSANCLWPGKALENSSGHCPSALTWEAWKRLLTVGFGVLVLAIVAFWGVNQWVKYLSYFSPSLNKYAFQMKINHGPGMKAQWLSPYLTNTGITNGHWFVSQNSTFHPAPCLYSRKEVEDGPILWNPSPMWEIQKRLLAFNHPATTVEATWGVNQRMKYLSLCVSPSFGKLLFQ